MALRVLVHVQHLKGTGHQHRTAAIARALAGQGAHVTYATGAEPVAGADLDGVRVERLPAVRAEGAGYGRLVDDAGVAIDDAWRARRRAATLGVFERAAPDVILLETFPFGRRKLWFELLALLDAAEARARRPAVAVSLRDVPEPRSDARERAEMVAIAASRCDRVLVHGDERVVRLEDTFPEAAALGARIEYTGYVVDARPGRVSSAAGHGEVLVSAGGGAAGARLLEAAMAAAALPLARADDAAPRWRVMVGSDAPPALRARAGAGTRAESRLVVEANREDFPGMLRNCAVSISQAGYNTMLDLVTARARAIVVPHVAGGEREQAIRAERFAALGLVEVVDGAVLPVPALAATLARSVRASLARPRPAPHLALATDGAARAARVVYELAGGE